ncbi:MAG: beta strand repeat-containing protein [Thermoguttaceae bacterium]
MSDQFFARGRYRAAWLSARFASFVVASIMLAAAPLRADTYIWVGSLGDWSASGNWSDLSNSGGTVPTGSDDAYIANGGTAAITQSGEVCNDLYLLNGNVQITGGNFSTTNNQYVGESGTGTITQSGGINTIAGNGALFLGNNAGSSGTYNLSSGGQLIAPNEQVGISGTGTFTQTGGTNSVSSALSLGTNAGGSGTYNLSGNGQLTAPSETVGFSGTGTFTQTGGTNSARLLSLGSGTYNLSGIGQLTAPSETVGFSGTATFTQTGGTNTIGSSLTLGYGTGSSGTYNLNGGLLVVSSLSQGSGTAAFNFSGGTLQAISGFATTLPMTLGTSGGATFITGSNAVTLSGSLSGPGGLTMIGNSALTLTATNTFSGNTLIGGGEVALESSLALQNSTLDTSGSGVLAFGSLTAATFGGLTGSGTLSVANVALSVGKNNACTTYYGMLQGAGSLSKIGSGTLLLGGSNAYTGATAVNAGTLEVANTASLPGYAASGKITTANGAVLAVSAGGSGWTAAGISTLLTSNGTGFASGSILGIDTSGGSLSYNSNIAGSMGLEKLGGNALILSGSNNYRGSTTVNAGTLVVTSDSALPNGTSLSVGAGGTLIFDPSQAGAAPITSLAASQIDPLPEPGTFVLFAAAVCGAAVYQRLRSSRKKQ